MMYHRKSLLDKEQQRFVIQMARRKNPDLDKILEVMDCIHRRFKASIKYNKIDASVKYRMDMEQLLIEFPYYEIHVKMAELNSSELRKIYSDFNLESTFHQRIKEFSHEIKAVLALTT